MADGARTDEGVATPAGAGLDLSSAMVRAESRDVDATLHALVNMLDSVPGLKMAVSYRHGRLRRLLGDLPYVNDLHRRTDPVREIVASVGSRAYRLRSEDGSIQCVREATSIERGQVREELSFSAWAGALLDDIAQQNLINHESLVALRQLVEDQV